MASARVRGLMNIKFCLKSPSTFSIALNDYTLSPKLLLSANGCNDTSQKYASKVWGPTCDGLDIVASNIQLPKLEIGDWLYIRN